MFGSAFLPPFGGVRAPKDIFQALSFANELQALADIRHFSFVVANLLKTLILLSVTRNVQALIDDTLSYASRIQADEGIRALCEALIASEGRSDP